MTTKHFKALALLLGELLKTKQITRDGVLTIADFCGAANPRFDRVKFLQAIGGAK